MGKTNKAQRTKGNTKPSSSGHSAQLLGRTTGFIGFDGLEKDVAQFVPVTGQQESDDSSVDSDFRMVMRKMLKRDAVTRLKAMQEFGDHCLEKEKDAVKNVLPFWPRLFNRLSLDCDRRIREATHISKGKLLSKVKREIAPYLKNVMGVWMMAQCDPHPPASCAARDNFKSAFPQPKRKEAILFCKEEIFAYFNDNLFEQTAKSMCEPNTTTSTEDMENKYVLVMTCTLQALKLLADLESDELREKFHSILTENKFWKLAKNKDVQIRASWFSLVSRLVCRWPSLFTEMDQKLATSVFSCLSEADPLLAPAVWEAALNIALHLQSCWSCVDVSKLVLPQLWKLLRSGLHARQLFPCLLPFLSKMPAEVVDTEDFLAQFFACMKQSLYASNVVQSSLECDAVAASFVECLQYVTCSRLVDANLGVLVLEKVLQKEIIPLLGDSFFETSATHVASSEFYPLLGGLIRKMECLSKEKPEYQKVLERFWESLVSQAFHLFDLQEQQQLQSATFISFMFHSLISQNASDELPPVTLHPIVLFSKTICDEIDADARPIYLKLLEVLLQNSQVARELVSYISSASSSSISSGSDFVRDVVLKWAAELDTPIPVWDLVIVLCGSLEEAHDILDYCSQDNLSFLEYLLSLGPNGGLVETWLRSSTWSDRIVSELRQRVRSGDFYKNAKSPEVEAMRRIVLVALQSRMLNNHQLREVTSSLHCLLEQLEGFELTNDCTEAITFFKKAARELVSTNQMEFWDIDLSTELVHMLFQIVLGGTLLGKLEKELFDALGYFLGSYNDIAAKAKGLSIIQTMTDKLKNEILDIKTVDRCNHLLSVCLSIHSTVTYLSAADVFLPSVDDWHKLLEDVTINSLLPIVNKDLFCLHPSCETFDSPRDQRQRFLLVGQMVASVLCYDVTAVDPQRHLPYLGFCLAFSDRNEKKEQSEFKSNCQQLFQSLAAAKIDSMFSSLLELSEDNSNWALVIQYMKGICGSQCHTLTKAAQDILIENHTLDTFEPVLRQVLIPHLSEVNLQLLLEKSLLSALNRENAASQALWSEIGDICMILVCLPNPFTDMNDLISQLFFKITEPGIREMDLRTLSLFYCAAKADRSILIPDHWDFFVEKLSNLLQSFPSIPDNPTPKEIWRLHQIATLFTSIWFCTEAERELPSSRLRPEQIPQPVSRDVQKRLLSWILQYQGGADQPRALLKVLDDIRQVVHNLEPEVGVNLLLEREDDGALFMKQLSSPIRPVQFAAQHMLHKVMPLLPNLLSEDPKNQNEEEEFEKLPAKLTPLVTSISYLDEIVSSMLIDVEGLCTVVPGTDSHVLCLAYLFAWGHLINYIAAAPPQLRVGYATYLEEQSLLSRLFSHLFRLMPPNPVASLKRHMDKTPSKDDIRKLFTEQPYLQADESAASSEEVSIVACSVYASALRRVPASVRTWWNNLDRKTADLVNSFTTKYVSGILCSEEIQSVHDNESHFENMTVVARPGSREVSATYTIDDCPLELCIQLPTNHPLGPVTVERRGKVVLGNHEWRLWIMQLTTLLTHQNGSILDGLSAWRRNLVKKFEGAEECMICYYVLHATTLRMPKFACNVCKKRFHHACIYKWCKTSNTSTCPMCRNEFSIS